MSEELLDDENIIDEEININNEERSLLLFFKNVKLFLLRQFVSETEINKWFPEKIKISEIKKSYLSIINKRFISEKYNHAIYLNIVLNRPYKNNEFKTTDKKDSQKEFFVFISPKLKENKIIYDDKKNQHIFTFNYKYFLYDLFNNYLQPEIIYYRRGIDDNIIKDIEREYNTESDKFQIVFHNDIVSSYLLLEKNDIIKYISETINFRIVKYNSNN